MALGVLPHQFPEWDYSTGKRYEEQDIIHIFGGADAFESEEDGREEVGPEYDEHGFNIVRTIQRIERENTEKGQTLKNMKERLEREWTSKVLSDSLEGSCMDMPPSKIKYRMPKDREEWQKVKRSTCIETPLHFDKEAERMIRQLLKDDIIEE